MSLYFSMDHKVSKVDHLASSCKMENLTYSTVLTEYISWSNQVFRVEYWIITVCLKKTETCQSTK